MPIDLRLDPGKNPFLSGLPREALDALIAGGVRVEYSAGSCVIEEGAPSDSLYVIERGEVLIEKSGVEIDRQSWGGVIGEIGVLTDQPRTATVRAITEVTARRIGRDLFLALADAHPALLRAMYRDLTRKIMGSQTVRLDQEKKYQKAIDTLGRCVSKEVLQRILQRQTPEELLIGNNSQASILFFDIRGFSSAAENMTPQRLLHLINRHLGVIINAVARYEGTIINFIGDAVLVVFNCPVPLETPADDALSCYEECRLGIDSLHRQLRQSGEFCFELGAGLNAGTVVAGAIGAEERFHYTVLGDEVNLSARLESLTRKYPVDVLMSESFVTALTDKKRDTTVLVDRIQVKGRETPVRVYTLMEWSHSQKKEWADVMELYLQGKFQMALDSLNTRKEPLAEFIKARCKELIQRQEPWLGYYRWDSK